MRTIEMPDGCRVPVVGQGTWTMGNSPAREAGEIAALQLGIDLGMTLIDTAEMYADGGAERVVGKAIRGRRDRVYVVTKVLPENATRNGTIQAAERSLERLGIETIDLYLLHWDGPHPLQRTLEAFAELQRDGKIRSYGVSNFDTVMLQRALALPHGGRIATNQVLYNLTRRGIEWSLLPFCRERRLPVMAYTPLEQGRMPAGGALARIAARHRATTYQVALAWTLRSQNVIAIPKSANAGHVRDNAAAGDLVLTDRDLAELDADFRPPRHEEPLATL
jgi:diketogulonate reductase-like aldo/keto reductase